jgi:hypothetical protein
MMNSKPLPLKELAKQLAAVGHGERSYDRLRVYAVDGVRVAGQTIKLEAWTINGRRCSSVQAYERFIRDQIDAQKVGSCA